MIILIHVIIAITSIIVASFALFSPSLRKLFVSYGLILGTVATGTYLLISFPSHILESCLMGITYVTIVSFMTIAAHVRLQKRTAVAVKEEN